MKTLLDDRWVGKIVDLLVNFGNRKATKYVGPNFVVKGTRRHKPTRKERTVEIVLTIGNPNWREREFIKAARKAGEPFPVKRIQLSGWNGK